MHPPVSKVLKSLGRKHCCSTEIVQCHCDSRLQCLKYLKFHVSLHFAHRSPCVLFTFSRSCQKCFVLLHELRALRDIHLHQPGRQNVVPNHFHDLTFTAFFKLERRKKGRKNIISGIGAQIQILNSMSNKEFK